MTPSYSLLIKPVSGDCNLRCAYCFYLPKRELFPADGRRMSKTALETVIRRYLAEPLPLHQFGWQGGEPTLAGRAFFELAVKLQRQYGGNRAISNALQTNGTLLDDGWGRFLAAHRFLVGLSLDGPARLHNRFRKSGNGNGSHAEVMRGLAILKRHRVETNILTLVSAANAASPVEIYRYLGDQGMRFQQYIDCVEFDSNGRRQPYALAPGQWGEFLCRLFDEWYPRDCGRISIRLFDSIISRLATGIPTVCPMNSDCRNYFVVECNGDLFPCDFFVRPELRLGNIQETGFAALFRSPSHAAFGRRKEPHNPHCPSCRFLPLCLGDCPKNRLPDGRSALCEDWQLFYSHTIGRFELLAERAGQAAAAHSSRKTSKEYGS